MIKSFDSRNHKKVRIGSRPCSPDSANLRVLTDSSIKQACQALRYEYFVVKRGWVEPSDFGANCESDRYDQHSHHLSVFEGESPLAYVRALPYCPEVGFMLDSEFSPILSNSISGEWKCEGVVELSRFVVSPLLRERRNWPIHPVELLLKALYRLALERGYRRFYIVVEEGWPQVFARRFGLPFQVIGEPYVFPDGTKTVAAVATLDELEAGMKRHSAAKYEWYRQFPEITESPK